MSLKAVLISRLQDKDDLMACQGAQEEPGRHSPNQGSYRVLVCTTEPYRRNLVPLPDRRSDTPAVLGGGGTLDD